MSDLVGGGYAPGKYMCRCMRCDVRHMADKRAIRCEPCAKIVLEERARAALDAMYPELSGIQQPPHVPTLTQALAELASLRAQVRKLREALNPFARLADDLDCEASVVEISRPCPENPSPHIIPTLTEYFRDARAALKDNIDVTTNEGKSP